MNEFRLTINADRLGDRDRHEAVADLLEQTAARVRNGKDGRGIWRSDGASEIRVGDFIFMDDEHEAVLAEFVTVKLHLMHANAALEAIETGVQVAKSQRDEMDEMHLRFAATSFAEALEVAGQLDSRHLNPLLRGWLTDLVTQRRALQKASDDGDVDS